MFMSIFSPIQIYAGRFQGKFQFKFFPLTISAVFLWLLCSRIYFLNRKLWTMYVYCSATRVHFSTIFQGNTIKVCAQHGTQMQWHLLYEPYKYELIRRYFLCAPGFCLRPRETKTKDAFHSLNLNMFAIKRAWQNHIFTFYQPHAHTQCLKWASSWSERYFERKTLFNHSQSLPYLFPTLLFCIRYAAIWILDCLAL